MLTKSMGRAGDSLSPSFLCAVAIHEVDTGIPRAAAQGLLFSRWPARNHVVSTHAKVNLGGKKPGFISVG
ncbi:MAG: hypothetical protein ACM3WU_00075 [Bacillota bacterium]